MIRHTPRILHPILYRPQLVTQSPQNRPRSTLLRQNLVNPTPIKIPLIQNRLIRPRSGKIKQHIIPIIHKPSLSIPHLLTNPAVLRIVLNPYILHCIPRSILINNPRQTIPIIPLILRHLITRNLSPTYRITFIVINIIVLTIRLQAVITSRLIPRISPIPIRIITKTFIRIVAVRMVSNSQLIVVVIGVISRSVE